MNKLKSVAIPVLLLIVFGSGLAGLRYMMWKETQDEREMVSTSPLTEAQSKMKKATLQPGRTAVVETNKGTIKFVLYEKDTPISCKNFIKLATSKFYDGSVFHRVEPGFVIQGGKPKDPKKKAGNINIELVNGLKHVEGAVGMARSDNPNSASCEFYITLAKQPALDENYAVFGKVIEGMDVVKKIKIGDVMKSVRIIGNAPAAGEAKINGNSKPK